MMAAAASLSPSPLFPLFHTRRQNSTKLRRSSSSNLRRNFLSPLVFRSMQLQNDYGISLHLAVRTCFPVSPLMSSPPDICFNARGPPSSLGDSAITCEGLCTVYWSIEADIADGDLIFITGDLVNLGCWEPEMAILLSPSSGHANLWKTEIEVPCGIHFRYNYFIKEEKKPFCDVVWRPGPKFSLSVPFANRENGVAVVKDSWMRTIMQRLPFPSWGSWITDTDLPKPHLHDGHLASNSGEHMVLKNANGATSLREQFSVDHIKKAKISVIEKDTPINAEEKLSERNQPVEEPWLIQSAHQSFMDYRELNEASEQDEVRLIKQDEVRLIEIPMNLNDNAVEEYKRAEESISTVILINSSVCTMQRIAILENEKLVELLLEPVKNNVQCDSIYLGVIIKLVPHMGGALVDIGISRPSLMEIKKNREPFVFPPFKNGSKGVVVNGSVSIEPIELHNTHEHDQSSYDDDDLVDEFEVDHQDNLSKFMHQDFEGREAENDMDVSDGLQIRVNADSIDSGSGEADSEEYCGEDEDHVHHDYAEDFLPSEKQNSGSFDLQQSILKDLKHHDDSHKDENKWSHVRKGTKVIVQVVKECLGAKAPVLSSHPFLKSRFWVLVTRFNRVGVSKKIYGLERKRLRLIANTLQPSGFGLTVRSAAAGHSLEELQKDLDGLLSTWKTIVEHAKSAVLASEEGVKGAVPVMLHRAMGQTLSVVQDYFNEKVVRMVVDSPQTYHEVTSYLQEIALGLCDRVELYDKRTPIFDEYNIEEEINNILSKRVPLSNGGSLVIEQTEALVSIDVNGGHGMLGQGTSQEKAVLHVNLGAAKQIARELRLRDIGGIIVVDFIDMDDASNKRLVYEEIKKAVERDRSIVQVSELSKNGLMEITRKRVRPSVNFMISEPCQCCYATGRVEALATTFSKIEHEICKLLAVSYPKPDPGNAKSWPEFLLTVDRFMGNYLTAGNQAKLAVLSSSLKVWIRLKVTRGSCRRTFEVEPYLEEKANDAQKVAISRLRPTEARTYIPSTKLSLPLKKQKSQRK